MSLEGSPKMLEEVIICIIAGLCAGIGTGFAGMSAAVVIAPMLAVFLGVPAYQSVGIALASDVLASACSAITYAKSGHIDLKHGSLMLLTVLIFTLIGSSAAYELSKTNDSLLGGFSIFMTLFMGVKFLIRPVNNAIDLRKYMNKTLKIIAALVGGGIIGFICGFVGAGGGMMMLFVLTTFLGYELKTAVGTSVFIMSFTALTGALSHFIKSGGVYDMRALIICAVVTLITAFLSSVIANRTSNKNLNRAVGIMLTVIGIIMVIFKVKFNI